MGRSSLARRSASSADEHELPAPAGLRASTVAFNNEEYLVLSYPSPGWILPSVLTEAEREVTLAVLRGTSTEAIAQERGTSVRTVANQVASIFEKIGVTSRIELAAALGGLAGPGEE